ncbi:Gfo/Idh/MocA family oxidoreductase [Paenibacillus sp. IB182496]|uniref:Gfo/Idh/MocA family oxidoreductase n=1 Tax=Paenibacillus sabuli TaxID=2772509 RepID=A0A927BXB6_9BACL|nr:Gfo/Idh/MocA family oxidoreductase [Paenibacillus sabuli]MBD2847058.1 Gfo/Idh/MocA family oxidoreductase [Paenibacillus sabuli]
MGSKLGIGIIGCGIIAARHIDACKQLGEWCEIKAVADISREKAEQAAASAGEGTAIYTDYKEMLERSDIDIISLCTPPFFHKEPALAAFAKGKHVLVEKPLAPSLEDCDAMIAAARAHNCKLATVFQLRFLPDIQKIKRILDSDVMGPLVSAQMSGNYWRGDKYYDVPWRGKFASECGGVTMNHAIHTMDLFLWLMGQPLEQVRAEMDTINHDIEVEDWSTATMRFAGGAVAQATCSLTTVREGHEMNFSSQRHYVGFPYALHAVQQTDLGGAKMDREAIAELEQAALPTGDEPELPTLGHCHQYYDLFEAIRTDSEPMISGAEGRRTIEAITAIYKSATLGEPVSLPIADSDPWYTAEGIQRLVKRSGRGESAQESTS